MKRVATFRFTPVLVGWALAALLAGCGKTASTKSDAARSKEAPRSTDGDSGAPGDEPAKRNEVTTFKIFSETLYQVVTTQMEQKCKFCFKQAWKLGEGCCEKVPAGAEETEHSLLSEGSGFLVRSGSNRYVVTAAHVVSRSAQPDAITVGDKTIQFGERTKIKNCAFRVRVSNLSLNPKQVLIDKDRDVAVLSLDPAEYDHLRAKVFDLDAPKLSDRTEVVMYGFPGDPSDPQRAASTPHQQFTEGSKITAVERKFFVTNSAVKPGYSGGPVLDRKGRLLGMIFNSTGLQTRCATAESIAEVIKDFAAKAVKHDLPECP